MDCQRHHDVLVQQLYKLKKDGKFCDAIIQVENEKFHCHKCVLAATSPLFCSLLDKNSAMIFRSDDMTIIKLCNVSCVGVRNLLEFLYTGKEPGSEENMKEFSEIKDMLCNKDCDCELFCKTYGISATSKFVSVEISVAEDDTHDFHSDTETNAGNTYFNRQDRIAHQSKQKFVKHRSKAIKNEQEGKIYQNYKLPKNPPFQCPATGCTKTCDFREQLRSHLRHVHAERRYSCEQCGSRFVYRKDLVIHTRIHTGEKPFSCDICSKTFSQKGSRNMHRKLHNKLRQSQHSSVCGKKSRFEMTKPSTIINNDVYSTFSSGNEAGLKSDNGHTDNMDRDNITGEFFNEITYNIKKRTVMETNNLDISSNSFITDEKTNKRHRKVTLHWFPLLCPFNQCDEVFETRTKLRSHIRAIHRERKYSCTGCQSRFVYEKDLLIHQRMHTGEKPFLCDHCGKSYSQKSSLNAHRRKNGLV